MFGTAIIVFREVLEASLIIGLVLAAARGVVGRGRWVSIGIVAGILGAIGLALIADTITPLLDGMGQEVMNASILFAAVIMLTWHLLWMKKHAAQMSLKVKAVGLELNEGSKEPVVLALIVGLAVLREGIEVVVLLYGIATAGTNSVEMLSGGAIGIFAGLLAGFTLYFGISRIPARRLFQVSGWLIVLLIAGLATQAVSYLVQADLLPALGNEIWNSSFLLSEQSFVGRILHVLVGYVDQPMGIQLLTYAVVIGVLVMTMSISKRSTKVNIVDSE